jgi:HPr kinase/phosphorylase
MATVAAMTTDQNIHATAVILDGRGVLIMGPSGAGKTDLAIRLIEAGGTLIADDRTLVRRKAGRVVARAPESIAGKIELRGYGILDVAHEGQAEIDLVIDLKPGRDIERMPEPAERVIDGVPLRLVELDGSEVSAVAKVRLILKGL